MLPSVIAFGIGTPELIIILVVVLLLFGAKRIPDLARGLGRGVREFKDASSEIRREIESEGKKDAASSSTTSSES